MSMAKKAARHVTVLMASRSLGMLIGIGTLLCYTRVFKPIELALIPIQQILGQLCYMVSNLGLSLYVQRKMPQLSASDPISAKELGRAFTAVMGVGVLACGFVIWLLSYHIAATFLKDPTRAVEIKLLIPAIVFLCWNQVILQVLRGRMLFVDISIYSIAVQIIHLPIVAGLYVWLGREAMILGLAVGAGLGSIFMSWRLRENMFGKISWAAFCRFVKDALPFYGEGYVGYLVAFADQWIIGLLMSPVELAIYYVPKTLITKLSALTDELHSVVLANISVIGSRGMRVAKHAFEKIRRLYVYIFVPLCGVLVSTSFFVIDLLGGPKYHAGAIPFAILSISLIVMGLYAPHSLGVMALADPKKRFFVVFTQSVMMLTALIPLAWVFRLNGVASAVVVARITGGIVSAHFLSKLFRFSWDRHATGVVAAPCVLLLIICGGGQLLFYHRLIVPLYLAAGLVIYGYFFTRRMSEDDVQTIEALLPSRMRWVVAIARRCRPSIKTREFSEMRHN